MDRFGDFIKARRRALGLTQWEVADQTGVSNTYISALESGRKQAPPYVIVMALAACLHTEEAALWALARSEREERLKLRIEGVPTSQRTQRSSSQEGRSSDSSPNALDQTLNRLRYHAEDPKLRRAVKHALQALLKDLDRKT
jgi:transcriptional regulator with XRE-family HTH domain